MASIFTFDPDPPRVSSPWTTATPPPDQSPQHPIHTVGTVSVDPVADQGETTNALALPCVDYSAITRLEAEPQEGPTEYKLHLLLRRRRSFIQTSTSRHVSGSLRRMDLSIPESVGRSASEYNLSSNNPPQSSARQSRQHRLEQLTTQMLWRLQQSCPHHSSTSTAGVLLQFPDESSLGSTLTPQKLYPGLEESKGALYEIGVADDGELVGLAEDEMEESLNNLRAMAASLGCAVDVIRMVSVGDCEWLETVATKPPVLRKSKLLVVEAYVHPDQQLIEHARPGDSPKQAVEPQNHPALPQLRVSLIGATKSGKSTLLVTLLTGTLDNGRGKGRLSLLKHRHERESGLTSSITQELIGYGDSLIHEEGPPHARIINYGCTDISSWTDIHASVESSSAGRLVFLTDSAGHPRFLRTTLRGLIGWDPHYTLLCVPADNMEDGTTSQDTAASTGGKTVPTPVDLDLSEKHLQLCLSLGLPLIVVITKYDLANKIGLKGVVSKVLSALKDAGRTGRIIADPWMPSTEADLAFIPPGDLLETQRIAQAFGSSPSIIVPIVLTSALNGTGLRKLHALLRTLPVPAMPSTTPAAADTLFHIEDTYARHSGSSHTDSSTIIGGHLRSGTLSIGDKLVLGPFPVDNSSDDSDSGSGRPSTRNSPVPTSKSFPGALQKRSTMTAYHTDSSSAVEWRAIRVASLRNLRLPVSTLYCGQVGTVGIVPTHMPLSNPAITRVRKGMVLSNKGSKAYRGISVCFVGKHAAQSASILTVGSNATVYVASVRASARVLSLSSYSSSGKALSENDHVVAESDGEGFSFGFGFDEDPTNDPSSGGQGGGAAPNSLVAHFQFIGCKEFIEENTQVLVIPGGGPGLTGSAEKGEKGLASFEGFVGKVVNGHA